MSARLACPRPGNVPELSNAIEPAVIMVSGRVIQVEETHQRDGQQGSARSRVRHIRR